MTKDSSPLAKRKHIRFRPDPTDVAYIDANIASSSFNAEFAALIVEEAPMGGCGIICLDYKKFADGDKLRIKVGKMDPVMAEVKWTNIVADGISRYGLQFLD